MSSSNEIGMKIKIAALIFVGSITLVCADQLTESVQQALEGPGFLLWRNQRRNECDSDGSHSPISDSQWASGHRST